MNNYAIRETKRNYPNYLKSSDTRLSDCYKSHSDRKRSAWAYCMELCYKLNGQNLRVVSHNMNIFTAGFIFKNETGQWCYMHITPTYDQSVVIGGTL